MHKDVDEILEEVIKERRNSGHRIVWEEGFREGYKIGYGQVYEEADKEKGKVVINLLEEGWTVEKIAMVLQEDVKTVRKWLQQT